MCVSLPINWTTTNGVVVMLNCGHMAHPQTIKMIWEESLVGR
jgi:hypothetical protein